MPITLEAAPAARITAQARQVRFWPTVLAAITGLFFAVGWVLGMAWFGVVYCTFAVREGWRASAGQDR